MHAANPTNPEPITVSVAQARTMSGLGNSTIYELLRAGKIRSTQIGGRRLVFVDSLRALLESGAASTKASA